MGKPSSIDGLLVQWGDRLFYPGNRIVHAKPPRLSNGHGDPDRATVIRERIGATVRCAPQVMVKVTGGGRGMRAIAAHFRYITKNGRLELENERGEKLRGKDSLREGADEWRFGGSFIGDTSDRREAFNIMLSMPRGTDPLAVHRAARDFAKTELADHKYVMVLHDHQANPHVHISVRAESRFGTRLNPRKTDLHRWRETFAERLRELGIDAEATRQATRAQSRNYDPLWRVKARGEGRLRKERSHRGTAQLARPARAQALEAWMQLGRALASSTDPSDRELARSVDVLLGGVGLDRPERPGGSPTRQPAVHRVDVDRRGR